MTILEESCSRIDHAEGYYEFVFRVANRRAVEVLFQHMNDLYPIHNTLTSPRLRLLIDFSLTDFPPLQPLTTQVRLFRQTHPVSLHPRTAVLYAGAFVGMVDSLLRTFTLSRETQVRLFRPVRRDEAIAWLMKD